MGIMNHKSPSSRYPAVGDNYKKREAKYGTGEWEGYIYDPFIDKYRPDPKVQKEYYEKEGLVDKQDKPSLFEQLYPSVAGVATYEIGKAAGPEIYAAGKSGLMSLAKAGTASTATTTGAETSGLASTAAENAAWNAGATEATGAAATEGAAIEAGAAGAEAGAGAGATTAGATGAEAGTAGAAGTEGAGAGIGASWAIPALATAYTLNQAYKNYKDSEGKSKEQAAKDSGGGVQGALTALIGGQYGYAAAVGAGVAGSMFGSKKGKDQQARDRARKAFQEAGFVDENWNVELANGQKFDIGKDGGDPRYKIDFEDPAVARDLGLVAPLATLMTGGSGKLKDDFSGYFTNAIRSGGDPVANARAMYNKAGITNLDQGRAALDELRKAGTINDQELAVFKNDMGKVFGAVPLEVPQAPTVAGPAPVTATPEQAMGALGSIGGATPGATTPITQGPALGGLMSLGRAQEPVVAVTPVARPTFQQPAIVQPSPFSGGLMSLQRPQQEQEMVVVPVARGGYR